MVRVHAQGVGSQKQARFAWRILWSKYQIKIGRNRAEASIHTQSSPFTRRYINRCRDQFDDCTFADWDIDQRGKVNMNIERWLKRYTPPVMEGGLGMAVATPR
jgi:hypothetical protein